MRARPESGSGQPGCQVYRSRCRQDELRRVTAKRKGGSAAFLAVGDGVTDGARGAVGAVAVAAERRWLPVPAKVPSGEQAAMHPTASTAVITSSARFLTVSGS